jgi:hypothetical protein
MCVLICTNSATRRCLEIPIARAYRQTLQCCMVSPDGAGSTENRELDEASKRRVMKRSAWLQAYCCYHLRAENQCKHPVDPGALFVSSCDFQKALQAIAKTWGHLLSLVGLLW